MPIHATAIVDPHAEIDSSVAIGPYCVIEGHVRIAAGCRIYQNVYLTGWTHIENDCEIHPGAVIGHAPQDIKYAGAKSYCRIGRGSILREYVTVHRATTPEGETRIGEDCFILCGAHVGHDCRVGDRVTLINDAKLGGHVQLGDRVTIGGGAGVHQFVRVGELVMIAANARAIMDVPPFALVNAAGKIAGLNRVGMRRAGMPREELEDIRDGYRLLYGRGLAFRQAVEEFARQVRTVAGRRLLEFLQAESKRGIAGSSRRRREAPDEI
jgi:UDP-N-acetylglucosamine acyltransferase